GRYSEAGVSGGEKARPARAPADLRGRHHPIIVEAQSGLFWGSSGNGPIECTAESVDIGPSSLMAGIGGILLVWRVTRFDNACERLSLFRYGAPRCAEVEQHGRAGFAPDGIVGGNGALRGINK